MSWHWSSAERDAFQASKDLLSSSSLLVHFDPQVPLTLTCDASAYGVGAVLSHCWPDSLERPIAYASRSLSDAERNYSQLEKEGLTLVYEVKHFHVYLFGYSFQLGTDHHPLLALLNERKSTSPEVTSCAGLFSCRPTSTPWCFARLRHADALSRLPLLEAPAQTQTPPELVLLVDHLNESPMTAEHIHTRTRHNPSLSAVLQAVKQGWPAQCPPDLVAFSANLRYLCMVAASCGAQE